MKRLIVLICFLSILSYSGPNFKKGEVLIKTKGIEIITSIGEGLGLLSYEKLFEEEGAFTWLLKFPTDCDIFEIIEAYKDNPDVIYAEPNYIRTIAIKEKETPLNPPDNDEPGILEVQEMAIRYNNISASIIKSWQKRAKFKALLPQFGLTYNKTIYGAASVGVITGPNDWSTSFTWDLGELIYNPDTTSIDERSRIMTRLRNEILQDVTKLYFERKRLIIEGKEKNALKIEELTALIDGYTGQGFSKRKYLDKR